MADDGAYIGTCPGCKKVVAIMLDGPDEKDGIIEFVIDLLKDGRKITNVSEYEIPALDIGRCRCKKD